MCTKIGWTSEHRARQANSKMTKRVRAYLCLDCHLWHVTASSRISDRDAFELRAIRGKRRRR